MSKLSRIKDKLNSVIFMSIGCVIAIIAVLLMFAPGLEIINGVYSSADFFWNKDGANLSVGAWPIFVGYMLMLVGGLILGAIALPVVKISSKLEKVLLIIAILALLIGSIGIMFIKEIALLMNSVPSSMYSLYSTCAGPYVAGSFGLVSAICGGISLAFDW